MPIEAAMTPTLFARVGTLLHGAGFIAVLSRELDIDLRTVQRWASGRMYPPHGIWLQLEQMLVAHQAAGAELVREITRIGKRDWMGAFRDLT